MKITDEEKFEFIKDITDNIEAIKMMTHSIISNSDKGQNALFRILDLLSEQFYINDILIKNYISVLEQFLDDMEYEEKQRILKQEIKVLRLENKKNNMYKKAMDSD